MMKRLLLLFCVIVLSMTAFAQLEVKEGSFKEVAGFVNINPDPDYQTDDNDLPFAVLKVRTENITDKQRHDLKFEGNGSTSIMLEYKTGEVWVYISAKYADYLKISHPDFGVYEFTLPEDLKPKCGYEMALVNKTYAPESICGTMEVVSNPIGANIIIDGKDFGTTPRILTNVPVGTHELKLAKECYNTLIKIITLDDKNKLNVNEKLSKSSFSVSATKKVSFARGNLQYHASTRTWRFAENQWDIIGNDTAKISPRYSGWIDFFGWGTGSNPTNSSTYNGDYADFNDWGNNSISNSSGKSWYTLTKEEWGYVLDTRSTNSGIRYAKATVNGVNGVILLPDNWSSSNYSLSNTNNSGPSYSNNIISQNDWMSKFESNGAIFLPAAGRREGRGFHGDYWSATYANSTEAYYLFFDEQYFVPAARDTRSYGRSVRLVCSAE